MWVQYITIVSCNDAVLFLRLFSRLCAVQMFIVVWPLPADHFTDASIITLAHVCLWHKAVVRRFVASRERKVIQFLHTQPPLEGAF